MNNRYAGAVSAFFGVWLMASLLTAVTGCTSRDAAPAVPAPKDGISEYRRIADDSLKALGGTMQKLAQVSAQTNVCPPGVVAGFVHSVDQLQVESVQLRARSQAMQARGDAYFQHWQENLARMKDARRRELAVQHHAELEQSFLRIKETSQKARENFAAFSAGLRKLTIALEKDAAAVRSESTRELMRTTTDNGRAMEAKLTGIRDELIAMNRWLTPTSTDSKH